MYEKLNLFYTKYELVMLFTQNIFDYCGCLPM